MASIKEAAHQISSNENMIKKISDKELKKVMSYLGSIKSEIKAKASRENGKLGGRPKGSKNKTVKKQKTA